MTTYRAADGRAFEGRIYSVMQDAGVFKLTVVELHDAQADEKALVGHAVETMTRDGTIKLDIPHRIRSTYGRQLTIARADGAVSYVAAFVPPRSGFISSKARRSSRAARPRSTP